MSRNGPPPTSFSQANPGNYSTEHNESPGILNYELLVKSTKREIVEVDPLALITGATGNSVTQEFDGSSLPQTSVLPAAQNQSIKPPPVVDVVEVMTTLFISLCRTAPLDLQNVPSNSAGVQVFARYNAWKHVISTSSKFITNEQPGFSGGVLSLVMKLRLEGLFRLKMFDELILEATKILISEEKRLTNSYSAMSTAIDREYNCDLSISMKILLAEVKSITGRNEEALEQFYVLIETLKTNPFKVMNSEYWIWRVRNAIVHAAVRQRNWRIAINELLLIKNHIKSLLDQNIQSQTIDGSLLKSVYLKILCRLSRFFLQIGDMKSGVFYCESAKVECESDASCAADAHLNGHVALARGLVSFTRNEYEKAFSLFAGIIDRDKSKLKNDTMNASSFFMESSDPSSGGKTGGASCYPLLTIFDSADSLAAAAANNFAVCALYLRKLKDAITALEAFILDDPAMNLNDAIVFNLCTLYDLSFAPEISTNKKKVLHRVATVFMVEDPYLRWKSFRLV